MSQSPAPSCLAALVAAALEADLARRDLSPANVYLQRAYIPIIDREKLSPGVTYIFCGFDPVTPASSPLRKGRDREIEVWVSVQKAVKPEDTAEVDACVELFAKLERHYATYGIDIGNGQAIIPTETNQAPYDFARLKEHRAYTGLFAMTFEMKEEPPAAPLPLLEVDP